MNSSSNAPTSWECPCLELGQLHISRPLHVMRRGRDDGTEEMPAGPVTALGRRVRPVQGERRHSDQRQCSVGRAGKAVVRCVDVLEHGLRGRRGITLGDGTLDGSVLDGGG